MGDTFNQNHSGGGNNVINIVNPRFDLTVEIMDKVCNALRAGEPVNVVWNNFGRSPSLGHRMVEYLKQNGFEVKGMYGVDEASRPGYHMDGPVTIHPNGFLGGIIGGKEQTVYIDVRLAS